MKIGEVSRVVGLSFEGFEEEAWALFVKLECRALSSSFKEVSLRKPHWELRNLQWGLAYERGLGGQGSGNGPYYRRSLGGVDDY